MLPALWGCSLHVLYGVLLSVTPLYAVIRWSPHLADSSGVNVNSRSVGNPAASASSYMWGSTTTCICSASVKYCTTCVARTLFHHVWHDVGHRLLSSSKHINRVNMLHTQLTAQQRFACISGCSLHSWVLLSRCCCCCTIPCSLLTLGW